MFTSAPWPCVTAMVERRQRWRQGRRAEAWAVFWLRLKGYRILARNFRVPVGEIDVIARAATWFAAAARHAADRHRRFDLMVFRPWRWPPVRCLRRLIAWLPIVAVSRRADLW